MKLTLEQEIKKILKKYVYNIYDKAGYYNNVTRALLKLFEGKS